MPSLTKQALDTSLELSEITKPENFNENPHECHVKDGILRIGNTHTPIYKPESTTKIPETLFFDIQQVLLLIIYFS